MVRGDNGSLRATTRTDPFYKTQESCCLNCQFLLLCPAILIYLSCDRDQKVDRVKTTSDGCLRGRLKAALTQFRKPNLYPTPIMATVCWAAGLIHYTRECPGGSGALFWLWRASGTTVILLCTHRQNMCTRKTKINLTQREKTTQICCGVSSWLSTWLPLKSANPKPPGV